MKTEYAWVIQRDDGKYLSKFYNYDYNLDKKAKTCWTKNIFNAKKFKNRDLADCWCLSIHKLIKVEIKVVEDE